MVRDSVGPRLCSEVEGELRPSGPVLATPGLTRTSAGPVTGVAVEASCTHC
jgi:hypothetical protein